MKLLFLSDSGHGWLRVPVAELLSLGIADKISGFSYVSPSGDWAYLEEDCDLSKYLIAKGWGNDDWTQNVMPKYTERSAVRSYDRFNAKFNSRGVR